MSGLSEDELEELELRIIDVVCRERPSWENKLGSSAIRDMLMEEGVEPPDFAMHDALHRLNGIVRFGLGGPQNPHTDAEARVHGGVEIHGFNADVCDA